MTLQFGGLQPISKELDIWKNSIVTWVRTRNEGRDTSRNPSRPVAGAFPKAHNFMFGNLPVAPLAYCYLGRSLGFRVSVGKGKRIP